jgi:hypothetical protein
MSKTIVAVIQEFHHTHVAQRQEAERSTAPLWKLVARVRFVQLVQPELFEREKIGQPFVPRLDMSRKRVRYSKGSIFRQQTSVDAPQNSSESASFSKWNVSKESNADLSPISDRVKDGRNHVHES